MKVSDNEEEVLAIDADIVLYYPSAKRMHRSISRKLMKPERSMGQHMCSRVFSRDSLQQYLPAIFGLLTRKINKLIVYGGRDALDIPLSRLPK